jgi:spore germination protein
MQSVASGSSFWSIGVDSAAWTDLAGSAAPNAVVAAEVQLDSVTAEPTTPDSIAPITATSPERLLFVTNWQGHRFHPEIVRRLATDRGAGALAAARLANLAKTRGAAGIVLDLEQQAPADLPALLGVIRSVRDSVHAHSGAFTAVVVPAGDTVAYPARPIVAAADFAIVALTDERDVGSAAGPLVTVERTGRVLGRRVADAGPDRLVVAIPTYGFVWRTGQPAQAITLADARRLATQANVDVIRDPAFQSLHAIHARDWEMWIGDAELARRLVSEARARGITRFAAWGARFANRP